MRIFLVEDFENLFRVLVVLRKDDRLAELFAVVDFQAVRHQNIEHLTNGVLVEHPFIESGGADQLGQIAVVLKGFFIRRLIFIGKLVIGNAFLQKFERGFDREEVHQIAVLDRLRQIVAVGRLSAVQLKDLVCIFINFILRRRGQTDERRVEVVENILIFIVDGTMRLVADHQIKVTAGE